MHKRLGTKRAGKHAAIAGHREPMNGPGKRQRRTDRFFRGNVPTVKRVVPLKRQSALSIAGNARLQVGSLGTGEPVSVCVPIPVMHDQSLGRLDERSVLMSLVRKRSRVARAGDRGFVGEGASKKFRGVRNEAFQRRATFEIPNATLTVVAHRHDPLAVRRESRQRHEAVHETDVHEPGNESSRRSNASPVNVFPRRVAWCAPRRVHAR